jgi:hypothetical protein
MPKAATVEPTEPDHIFNHDILFLYDMINRYIVELMHSQSNGVSGMIVHDIARVETYLAALVTKRDWIADQPILDLPETHPRPWALEGLPLIANVESEGINQFIRLFEALRTEMINSQSARLASTLLPADLARFDGIVAKMSTFLTDYIMVATPLDLPESSPMEALIGKGAGGV